ncbi:hypothetical protein ACDJ03_10350 [Xanthomonas axonopodis pv. nakataecorchori]|uniref:hypothetical protein n=1 Tax=Xanthomonas axonopodis TaxID=53413 RepID=UPI003530BADD
MNELARALCWLMLRRVLPLILVVVAHALVVHSARAAESSCSSADVCDEGQAYSAANGWIKTTQDGNPDVRGGSRIDPASCETEGVSCSITARACATQNCGGFQVTKTFFYVKAKTCATRPPEYGWLVQLKVYCHEGCGYGYSPTDAGYVATGSACSVSADNPSPEFDADGDGVPDDKDAFPNDPNESKDTDGDGIGDNADVAPEDPENGKDKDEGNEKDNQAGGGGTCGAPPTCSGDAIACNTNWQIWRMRCQGTATGSVTGDVTNCSAGINVTSPDPLANASIILQRKIACKTSDSNGNQGDGQQPEWTKVNGMSQDPGKGGTNSDIPGINEVQVTADTLDQSGFGGGACVGFVAASSGTGVSSGFTQSLASPPAFFCDYIGWLKLAIITGAAIYSVIVISKGHA